MNMTVKGYVSGKVQGVGFRYFVRKHAQAHAVTGYAINLDDGRVEFLLQGSEESVAEVVRKIRKGPPFSNVMNVEQKHIHAGEQRGFTIG